MDIWNLKPEDKLSVGTVKFISRPFITLQTDHPPGAHSCAEIYLLGLEVYIQPLSGYWNGWVTTYKEVE